MTEISCLESIWPKPQILICCYTVILILIPGFRKQYYQCWWGFNKYCTNTPRTDGSPRGTGGAQVEPRCAQVEPRWCPGGAQAVPRWCTGGAQVVPMWCPGGAQVVPMATIIKPLLLPAIQLEICVCASIAKLRLLPWGCAQIVPRWFPGGAKAVSTWCPGGAQVVPIATIMIPFCYPPFNSYVLVCH